SGHILCLDRHSTGDGIVSALQVLAAMRAAGVSLKALLSGLQLYPQKLVNVGVAKGFRWQESGEIVAASKAAEVSLAGEGRILLRPSGTEPLLRVMVEGRDGERVARVAEELASVVRTVSAAQGAAGEPAVH